MPVNSDIYESASPGAGKDQGSADTVYRVVIQGINSEIETVDSFAIKYGILTSTPVTRLKLMMRSLPKTIMETKSAPKARGALGLIQEAGGIGLIEEYSPEEELRAGMTEEVAEDAKSTAAKAEDTCARCGFPLKKGDEFCQFCHTPLVEKNTEGIKSILKAGGGGHLVSPKRLLIYVGILLLVIIIDIILK